MKIKPKKLIPSNKKFHLLWNQELSDMLCFLKGSSKCASSYHRATISDKIFTKVQTHKIVNIILNDRYLKKQKDDSVSGYGVISMRDILGDFESNKEKLQKKFNKAIKK